MRKKSTETCSHCGSLMFAKKITVLRKMKEKIFSFADIPAQVCHNCGEQWYAADTLKMMEAVMHGGLELPFRSLEAVEYSLS